MFVIDAVRTAAQLQWLMRSQYWERTRIREYQARKLDEQLRYALSTVPYYKDLGLAQASSVNTQVLDDFPPLNKSVIQHEGQRLCNPLAMTRRTHVSSTSGTSGEPTRTWFDTNSWLLCKVALKIRRTLLAGPPWGQRLLIFDESSNDDGSIAEPQRRNYLLFRETRLSLFAPATVQIEALSRLAPTALYGSPSGVKELCDFAAQHDIALPRIATIFLASELIQPTVRDQIERQLSGRVVGIYGSTEFKEIAYECLHGRYHINFESVFVESLPEDGQSSPRLLITSLVNTAMPLIRFDIGDYAQLRHDPCACGRQSPYLTDIEGRAAEFLELEDGRRLSPYRLTLLVESTPGLQKFQFVQNARRKLALNVVFFKSWQDTESSLSALRAQLYEALGQQVSVSISIVDDIPRTRAGKHQVVMQQPEGG